VEMVVEKAEGCENFVRIDMEGSPHTQRTLEVYEKTRAKYDNVGVAIQAYLYRSEEDVRRLIPRGLNVRLCKGAYLEPREIAFPKKSQVDDNFTRLMEVLFAKNARAAGAYPAIATHDERMIDWALDHVRKNGVDRGGFEFQMLYGIRCDLQDRLAKEGYRVRAYVPYGTHWYPYFMRRLAERPANLIFLLRNVFRG
jgi:proline dehydrogenase